MESVRLATDANPDYALGYDQAEFLRLGQQANLLDASTARFLWASGLRPGMRVLDCGSGAGHVTAIAASIVGPQGSVVGVDRNASTFEGLLAAFARKGIGNVEFVSAELPDLSPVDGLGSFDAAIGRLVLLYLPDTTEAIRRIKEAVRPNGIIAFQDIAVSKASTHPPCPIVEEARDLLSRAFKAAGANPDCGFTLDQAFRRNGLRPVFDANALMDGVGGGSVIAWVAETLASLKPVIDHFLIENSLDLTTIADAMLQEVTANEAIVIGPLIINVFAHLI